MGQFARGGDGRGMSGVGEAVDGRRFSAPPGVVLLPASRQVPTGLGTIRCLGRAGVPVIAVGSEACPPAATSKYISLYLRLPDYRHDEAQFIDALKTLGRQLGSQGVLFVSADDQSALLALHSDELSRDWRFDYLAPATINACLNKALTAAVAGSAGVDYPSTELCVDAASIEGCVAASPVPAIVKPLGHAICDEGHLQRLDGFKRALRAKAYRALTKEKLKEALRTAVAAGAPCIVQQEIPGDVAQSRSVGIYMDDRQQVHGTFVGRKVRQYPADIGTGTLCEALPSDPELIEASVEVLRATGYRGIAEVEWKLDINDGRPWLIEINARPWAWIAAAEVAGVNLAQMAWCSLTRERMPKQEQQDTSPRWLDLLSDLDGVRAARRNGNGEAISLREYRQSLAGPKEYAFFARDDWRPGMMRLRDDLSSRLHKLSPVRSRTAADAQRG